MCLCMSILCVYACLFVCAYVCMCVHLYLFCVRNFDELVIVFCKFHTYAHTHSHTHADGCSSHTRDIISRHEKLEEERKQQMQKDKDARKRAKREQKALQRAEQESGMEGEEYGEGDRVVIESDSDDESVGRGLDAEAEGE
ncbi:hypothetical protein EON63_24335, partial [archaeon]